MARLQGVIIKKRITSFCCWLLLASMLPLLYDIVAFACVGRKLQIGYKNYTEQEILAEMLAALIRERTGTGVTLKAYNSNKAAYHDIKAGEIQVFIEYSGIGLRDILGGVPNGSAQEIYQNVKNGYKSAFDLIWLKPFGFHTSYKKYKKDIKAGIPLEAAPVVHSKTLKKFPALARLINKLSGKIDDEAIAGLIYRVDKKGERPADVAGKFLKTMNISFSFIPQKG